MSFLEETIMALESDVTLLSNLVEFNTQLTPMERRAFTNLRDRQRRALEFRRRRLAELQNSVIRSINKMESEL